MSSPALSADQIEDRKSMLIELAREVDWGNDTIDFNLNEFNDLVQEQTYFTDAQKALGDRFRAQYLLQKQTVAAIKMILGDVRRNFVAITTISDDEPSGYDELSVQQFMDQFSDSTSYYGMNGPIQDQLDEIEAMLKSQTFFPESINKKCEEFFQTHAKYKEELQQCFSTMRELASTFDTKFVVTVQPKEGKPFDVLVGAGERRVLVEASAQ